MIEALKELAEKVEAGTMPDWYNKFSDEFEGAFGVGCRYSAAFKAYNGSLDAAHALHKAVLGEAWECNLSFVDAKAVASCRMFVPDGKTEWINEDATTPARAWLLAIIKAKISELEA